MIELSVVALAYAICHGVSFFSLVDSVSASKTNKARTAKKQNVEQTFRF